MGGPKKGGENGQGARDAATVETILPIIAKFYFHYAPTETTRPKLPDRNHPAEHSPAATGT